MHSSPEEIPMNNYRISRAELGVLNRLVRSTPIRTRQKRIPGAALSVLWAGRAPRNWVLHADPVLMGRGNPCCRRLRFRKVSFCHSEHDMLEGGTALSVPLPQSLEQTSTRAGNLYQIVCVTSGKALPKGKYRPEENSAP